MPADTTRFVEHEKAQGMSVTYERIPSATHGTVAYLALPGMLAWLDRATAPAGDGAPAPSG